MHETPSYSPPPEIRRILEGHGTKNSIMAEDETPDSFLDRVVDTLLSVEAEFGTSAAQIEELRRHFTAHFIARDFTPGIPTLTNAGRQGYESSALSSCVVVPVDLRQTEEATATILRHYRQNMGSGFNFTRYKDPVAMLRWLNELSNTETQAGQYHRRIANMGTLHVTHPRILEFIRAKKESAIPYFNISIEVTDDFMSAAENGSMFTLADGSMVNAGELLHEIAEAAWMCGDPGIINLGRMNEHNPIASLAPYDCSPPCGEMGLAPGETCQFGYINLANFIVANGEIRYQELADTVKMAVRVLDDAIEYGIANQPTPEGQQMAKLKRKIGVSVAGLADALLKARLPYDSPEGRELATEMVAFINYHAKLASVQLARERGSCTAMDFHVQNQYYSGYLAKRYAPHPTKSVSSDDWLELDRTIAETGMLRNIHHTALPPGGRASMILGGNHSIEPIFSPTFLGVDTIRIILDIITEALLDETGSNADVQKLYDQALAEGTFQNLPISDVARRLLKTAVELEPHDHLQMTASLAGMNGVSDESASKTVNLPHTATVEEIYELYLEAHNLGLKNITVYRDGSLDSQPRQLA